MDAFHGPHAGEDRKHAECGEFMLPADGNRGQAYQCVAPESVWRQPDAGEESQRGGKRELVLYRSGEPVNAGRRARHDTHQHRVEESAGHPTPCSGEFQDVTEKPTIASNCKAASPRMQWG